MPFGLAGSNLVNHPVDPNTLILTGGYNGEHSGKILKTTCSSTTQCTNWQEIRTLSVPRNYHISFIINANFNCTLTWFSPWNKLRWILLTTRILSICNTLFKIVDTLTFLKLYSCNLHAVPKKYLEYVYFIIVFSFLLLLRIWLQKVARFNSEKFRFNHYWT